MTQRTTFGSWHSAFAKTIDVIGEWWTPIIIRQMFIGVNRFEAMQETLGIARNILTDRLNRLVASGIVEKVQYSERPVRFEYHLTEMGHDLYPAFAALKHWGDKWLMNGEPSAIPIHTECKSEFFPRVVCSECGEEIRSDQIGMKRGPGYGSPSGYSDTPYAPPE